MALGIRLSVLGVLGIVYSIRATVEIPGNRRWKSHDAHGDLLHRRRDVRGDCSASYEIAGRGLACIEWGHLDRARDISARAMAKVRVCGPLDFFLASICCSTESPGRYLRSACGPWRRAADS